MPDNNQNQQLSFDEILQSKPLSQEFLPYFEQDKKLIEHIADILNQSSDRKSTLGFTIAWHLGIKGMFGAIAAFLTIIPFIVLTDPPESGIDAVICLILFFLIVLGILGFYLLYVSFKTLHLFKKGYYTLGLRIASGVFIYKDESGITHQWSSTWYTRLLQQPCPDCNRYLLYLLAVDRNNPEKILIIDVDNNPDASEDLSFLIPEWFVFLRLPVTFNSSRQLFATTYNYYYKLLAVIGGFVIFIKILDYFNL